MFKSATSYYLLFGFNNNYKDWIFINGYQSFSSLKRYVKNHYHMFSGFKYSYYDAFKNSYSYSILNEV